MKQFRRFLALAVIGTLPVAPAALALDVEKAKEIYGPCAACHGEYGAGGKKGEYPRIAGQRSRYMVVQLKAFQSQARINLPMYPYTKERDLPDEDMKLVSDWLESVELPTKMPTFKGDEDALTRLQMVDKVMLVPRPEGDVANGGKVYEHHCVTCHGKTATGRGSIPMIVGQYTNYLMKQMKAFLNAERAHDEESPKEGSLYKLKEQDLQDILAYLTTLQNQE